MYICPGCLAYEDVHVDLDPTGLDKCTGIMRHIAAFLMFIVATDALIFCFIVIFTCR